MNGNGGLWGLAKKVVPRLNASAACGCGGGTTENGETLGRTYFFALLTGINIIHVLFILVPVLFWF
jgi:hypothetical protein